MMVLNGGQVSLVKVVEEFDSIDEAEDFAELNDIYVWGENKDWNLNSI